MNQSLGGVKNRRAKALQFLENQLISGVKPAMGEGNKTHDEYKTPLTDVDVKRINKEIEILKSRV